VDDPFDDDFLRRLQVLQVVARRLFRSGRRAERKSRKIGSGIEFADHRPYVAGDDIRNLDWNVLARLGQPLVRLHEEDEDLPIRILVDVSDSMTTSGGTKLRQARRIAAALAYVGLSGLDRVGLTCASGSTHEHLPPLRGKARIFRALEFLRGCDVGGTTDLRGACARLAAESAQPGVTFVISDFYDLRGAFAGLNLLRFRRHDPVAIQVIDPAEAAPRAVTGLGDVVLADAEGGDEREVTLSPAILEAYAAAHERFCLALAHDCRSRGIVHLRASTTAAFDDLVLKVFRHAGVLS
jgi:uncharacterized protein (DUF58 family)